MSIVDFIASTTDIERLLFMAGILAGIIYTVLVFAFVRWLEND